MYKTSTRADGEQIMKQNTREWEEFRKTKVGASDAPVIMGVSPWKTPYRLWQEKIGEVISEEPNKYMRRGLELEGSVRFDVLLSLGIEVFPKVLISKEHPWMMASLDGIDESGKIVIEIKCPGKEDHAKALSGKVPEKYFPQLQHQMFVAEVDSMLYISFDGENSKVLTICRDDRYIENMIKKERDFLDCVETHFPPELTDKDYITRQDDAWISLSKMYHEVMVEKALLEKEEAEIKKQLLELAGGQNTQGAGIRLTKVLRKGTIAYDKIEALKGVDLEKYRKSATEYWKFSA